MTSFNSLFGTFKFKDSVEQAQFNLMFDHYMAGIPDNFYKNQFDLAKESGDSYEEWSRFLQHSAFAKWKSEQIAIIANTSTDKALAGGDIKDKEALNLLKARQDVLANENVENKPTIIVMPESLFFGEDK